MKDSAGQRFLFRRTSLFSLHINSFYLKHQRGVNIIFPLLLGLSVLLWLYPFRDFIYGEGNLLFANPFSFNISPLEQFHYSFSYSFPLSDGAPYVFLDAIFLLADKLSTSIVISEDLLFVFLSTLQAYGIFFFLRVLGNIDHNKNHNFIAICIISTIYMFNPFTLSVTWWSLQGWTLFYILAPYFLGIFLQVSFYKKINKSQYLKVLIILFVLSPGLNGAFAVPFLYTILFFVIYLIFNLITSNELKGEVTATLKKIVLIVLPGVLIDIPIFLPYVILPLHGQIAPGYVSTINVINSFIYQSRTTQFFRVVTLVAFNWIYNAPLAYPWIGYLSFMTSVSYLLVFFLILGMFYLKTERTIRLMYIFMIIPLFVSLGNNFPVGDINLFLLKLGGPFYVITNGYYLVGQLYVVALMGVLFTILNHDVSNSFDSKILKRKEHTYSTSNKKKYKLKLVRFTKISIGNQRKIVYILVFVLLVTYIIPFFSYGVYKESGPYSTEINVPSSFNELNQYFMRNYSGPIYNVLVLPLSSNGVFYMKVNQSSWQDNGQFISAFIPYPLIQSNNSEAAFIIDTFLPLNSEYDIANLFQYFHIKYVVITPFYNNTVSNMVENTQGEVINYTQVSKDLTKNFGPPAQLGGFLVYRVDNVSPILSVSQHLFFSSSQNVTGFFGLLASLNETNTYIDKVLKNTVLTSSPVQNAQSVTFEKITNPTRTYSIPYNEVPFAILQNGSVLNVTDINTSYRGYGIESFNSTSIRVNLSLVSNETQRIKYLIMAPLDNLISSIRYTFVVKYNGDFEVNFQNKSNSMVFVTIAYPDFLGLWSVGSQSSIKIYSQFQTVFYVSANEPNLSIDYSANFDAGLFVLVGELVVTIILSLAMCKTNDSNNNCRRL